jgi:hypothetical protein
MADIPSTVNSLVWSKGGIGGEALPRMTDVWLQKPGLVK